MTSSIILLGDCRAPRGDLLLTNRRGALGLEGELKTRQTPEDFTGVGPDLRVLVLEQSQDVDRELASPSTFGAQQSLTRQDHILVCEQRPLEGSGLGHR